MTNDLKSPQAQKWQQEGGPVIQRNVTFSPCRTYRYTLRIVWDESLPVAAFVGLNPSTADEYQDDPTIRRCKGFAQSWGCGGQAEMTKALAGDAEDKRKSKTKYCPKCRLPLNDDHAHRTYEEHDACRNRTESPLPQPEYKKLHERIELEEMRGYCEQMEEKIKTLQVDRDFWAQTAASINPESPLPGREAQEESRTIVGLADDLAEALYTVIAAIPKQTEDADWWQDDLSTAVREANKLLAEYTAFPDAPQLPVRPQAVKPSEATERGSE